jgi:hypothetical protein
MRLMKPYKTSIARVFLPVKCSLQEIVLTPRLHMC